nr:hypothetical protein [Streptococcus sobrinus]
MFLGHLLILLGAQWGLLFWLVFVRLVAYNWRLLLMSNEKSFVKTAGILALVTGIITMLLRFVKWGMLVSAVQSVAYQNGYTYGVGVIAVVFGFIIGLIRLATFIYGILGISKFSNDPRVTSAAPILLIVAFGINVIPYLGIVADILTIVGGALFLASIKKLDQAAPAFDSFGMPVNQTFPQNPANGFANEPVQQPLQQDSTFSNPVDDFNGNPSPWQELSPQEPAAGFSNETVQQPSPQDNSLANSAANQAQAEPTFSPQSETSESDANNH